MADNTESNPSRAIAGWIPTATAGFGKDIVIFLLIATCIFFDA